MKIGVLLMLGVGLALFPLRGRACSCVPPALEVYPTMGDLVPTNTQVWIVVWPSEVKTGGELSDKRLLQEGTFILAPEPGGAPVPARRRVLHAGPLRTVEITPVAPLQPQARYVVRVRLRGTGDPLAPLVLGWSPPSRGLMDPMNPSGRQNEPVRPDVEVGHFQTAAGPDLEAPALGGVLYATYRRLDRAGGGNCTTTDPYAELVLDDASDRGSLSRSLRFAVYAAPGGKPVDYGAPPLLYLRSWADRLQLGHPSICRPSNFAFPARGKLKLGVRAMDLAGNMGPPSEVVLDLSAPLVKRQGTR